MLRRALILCPFATALHAITRQEALERLAPLASALSEADASAFMRRIHPDAADRVQLRQNVVGLIARYEITCSIDITAVSDEQAEFDWYMELRGRSTQIVAERRQEKVTVVFGPKLITAIHPISFFAAVRQ